MRGDRVPDHRDEEAKAKGVYAGRYPSSNRRRFHKRLRNQAEAAIAEQLDEDQQ